MCIIVHHCAVYASPLSNVVDIHIFFGFQTWFFIQTNVVFLEPEKKIFQIKTTPHPPTCIWSNLQISEKLTKMGFVQRTAPYVKGGQWHTLFIFVNIPDLCWKASSPCFLRISFQKNQLFDNRCVALSKVSTMFKNAHMTYAVWLHQMTEFTQWRIRSKNKMFYTHEIPDKCETKKDVEYFHKLFHSRGSP